MTLFIILSVLLAGFLALNIGANNSAASMATSYGAGVRTKKEAVILIAIFVFLGAIMAGAPVVDTMGKGLVPSEILSSNGGLVLVVLLLAMLFISWANFAKVPIATTHAIVCALVGVGLYTNSLNAPKFIDIVIWWVLGPVAVLVVNYLIARFFYFKILHFLASNFSDSMVNRLFGILLTVSGIFIAFSAGANNSANAVGPIVGLGVLESTPGAVLAGFAMAVGALVLGGRVLETVGKQITEICIIRAISVEVTGGILITAASFAGIPVSIAEIITCGVLGFSFAQHGVGVTAKNRHVLRIAFFWVVVPIASIGLSYIFSSLYFSYGLAEAIEKLK